VTAEDASRHQLYNEEKQRERLREQIGSAEEWLRSLGTELTVEESGDADRVRVVQLMNKTNQMNLSTRRVSEPELRTWLQPSNRKLWAFRVKDRFGDSGLTGILSLEIEDDIAQVTDFVLSCRVMGRNVERAMVAFAASYCKGLGLTELRADYLPTAKNKPCLKFWMSSGFSFEEEQNRFTWPLNMHYAFPEDIKIHQAPAAEGGGPRSRTAVLRDPEDASLSVFTD